MTEFDGLSTDTVLLAAWKSLRPPRGDEKLTMFPRGFWPDVARVAVEMMRQKTLDPVLDFRPTMCGDVVVNMRRGKEQKLPMKEMMAAPVEEEDADNPFNWAKG